MKRIGVCLSLLLALCKASQAITYQAVRASTNNVDTPTAQTGTMNLSSGTITNLNATTIKGATGTFTGTVTAGTFSPASAFSTLIASTNVWTGGNTYRSTSTFLGAVALSSNVIDGSATQGTAGQSLQSNAGSAPTWVNVPSKLIATTTTWTAAQTFAGSSGNPIFGTNTNDAAGAGYIGEYITSYNTPPNNFPTSTQYGDGTSISLTAGDWDVMAAINVDFKNATTAVLVGISTSTGNNSGNLNLGDNLFNVSISSPTGLFGSGSVPMYRVAVAATTTYYLKISATFTGTTPQYGCRLSARRRR